MCRTGGPRCPKEAKRILNKAREMFEVFPDDPTYKGEFKEALYQYHLTREGLDKLKAIRTKLQPGETKTDRDHIQSLNARISGLEWHRAHLLKREKCAAVAEAYAEKMVGDDAEARVLWEALLKEGTPLRRPNRSTVEEWMEEDPDMGKGAGDKGGKALPFSGAQLHAMRNIKRRIAMNEVIRSVPGITTLAEPGSQAHLYPRDENGEISEVYYSSYGSNVNSKRFMSYIEGGKAGSRTYSGCTDKTEPSDEIRVRYPHPIYYAMKSRVWDGGVAFLDHSTEGASLGKAYKITGEQFKDVVAQESGGKAGDFKADLNEVVNEGILPDLERSYGTLVHVGDHNGRPVFTFTSYWTGEDALYGDREYASAVNKGKKVSFNARHPSHAYVHSIGKGLANEFRLSKDDIATYFGGQLGAHRHSDDELHEFVNKGPKPKPPTTYGNGYSRYGSSGSNYRSSGTSASSGGSGSVSHSQSTTPSTPTFSSAKDNYSPPSGSYPWDRKDKK